MPESKLKFIVTVDEITAKNLYAAGFKLISQNGGRHVFLNEPPKNFVFEGIDNTKFCYTNILTI